MEKPQKEERISDVQAGFEAGESLGRKMGEVHWIETESDQQEYNPFTIIRDGRKMMVFNLEALRRPCPTRIERDVTFLTVSSFAAYVNEFKSKFGPSVWPRLYANPDGFSILAILDDHSATEGQPPAWCSHRATFRAQVTDEWAAWKERNRTPQSQVEFAEFIEEHVRDIREPTGAEMLEIATNLSSHKTAKFGSALRLKDGQVQFSYVEDISGGEAKGSLVIPDTMTLAIAPFLGMDKYEVLARFRYRFPEGRLTMFYALMYLQEVECESFKSIIAQAEKLTGLPALIGYPSSFEKPGSENEEE